MKKIPKLLAVAAVLWILCFAWYLLAPSSEQIEALYSRGLYRWIVGAVVPITGAFPFSLMILLCVLGPLAFVVSWAGNWVYRRKRCQLSHWRGFLWGPKWLFFLTPCLWLWFLLFWGMGYQRMPVEARLDFGDATVTDQEIEVIRLGLLQIIEQDQPVEAGDRDVDRAIRAISLAMAQTVAVWEGRSIRLPERVKATPPGLLLMNGTAGMCTPFTLEAHVDGGLPDTSFVAVGAHELGHIAGVCDEGETNMLGYIAGLRADDPYARYAVALGIYRSLVGLLPGDARGAAIERLPEQAREDIRRARAAQERYRIDWLQRWSWRAYNQYLKSQGVSEGVRSYGRGTQLLAHAWRAGHIEFPPMPETEETL